MNFIVNNQENLETNSSVLFVNTRNKHHLRRSIASVLCFRKVHQNVEQFMTVSQILGIKMHSLK